MTKAIDTHAHLWPDEYLELLEKLGSEATQIAKDMHASWSEEDLKKRFTMMEESGVSSQVLSATPQIPQYGNAQQALSAARFINDAYKDLIKAYPDRFRAYGVVPLPHVKEAIQEGRRLINDLKFLGIALNTVMADGLSVTDPSFLPFFEAMNQLGTTIYIHPTGRGAFSPMINDYEQEWVVGAPIEDMVVTLQLLKEEFPQKFPNLRFHIAHLGGGISFQMQRIIDNYEDWNSFTSHPLETLKKHFWFDSANFLEESLIHSSQILGNERILAGSDFPYFQGKKYQRAFDYIRDSKLSEEEKKAILNENARAFYADKW